MLQRRVLNFPQTWLALHGVVSTRLSNAQNAWRLSRPYASAAKDSTADQHQKLISQIRAYQKENVTIPWYALGAQYRLSFDSMEQILAQDDARIRAQKELSLRISQRADQLYNEERGRCDWETLAIEFDKPLIECLALYDATLSTIVRKSRPNIEDWQVGAIGVLKEFVTKHIDIITSDNLRLASIYMNVRYEDCIPIYSLLSHLKMTTQLHKAIKQPNPNTPLWSPADENRLIVLASANDSTKIDWAYVSKELGRGVYACKLRHAILTRKKGICLSKYVDAVDSEVKRQYEQRSVIDWAQVSQAVGLSELQCLEICQFNEGKVRWVYGPDTFSWDTANKMTAFIEANYPTPIPVNYRAVSNYMWVDADDCS
ncbi:hypothetical protein H4R20_004587, partial [Coemansia guatemalensis]